MKKLLFSTMILIVLMCRSAFGTDYYVTQSGAGGKDGKAIGSAWAVSDFNDSGKWDSSENADKIDPGDTVYFSGSITTGLEPQGSGTSGNYITLDGYAAGDCDPINSSCSSSALIDLSGSGVGIETNNQDYLIVQDFRIADCSTGISASHPSTSDYITIRRNDISVCVGAGIYAGGDVGLSTTYWTIGGASGDGNKIYNIGLGSTPSASGGLRFLRADDFIISYNHIYNDSTTYSDSDGIVVLYSTRHLYEYNTVHSQGEDAIDWKAWSSYVIIRFNDFYDTYQSPCQIQRGTDYAWVYGNRFWNASRTDASWHGLLIYRGADYVRAWSNLIFENRGSGIGIYAGTGEGDDLISDGIYLYNNTIFGNAFDGDSVHCGLYRSIPGDVTAKNNIFAANQAGSYYRQLWATNVSNLTLDYNLYYFDGVDDPIIRWDATYYTLTDPVSNTTWNTATSQGANSRVVDPQFVDTDTDDFELTSISPCIDSGEDLSGCSNVTIQGIVYSVCYDDALDPDSTDWSTTPPTVTVVKQDDHGSDWERGAYAYITGVDYPESTIDLPATNQTIAAGAAVNFTGTPSSGTSPYTYLWNFDGGAANVTTQDPGNTTFSTPGVYTVTFTVTDSIPLADPTPDSITVTVTGACAESYAPVLTADQGVSIGRYSKDIGGTFYTPPSSECLCELDVYVMQVAGTIPANYDYYFRVYSVDGSNQATAVLGTSSKIEGENLTVSTWIADDDVGILTFSPCVSLTGSTKYGIAGFLDTDGDLTDGTESDSINYWALGMDNEGVLADGILTGVIVWDYEDPMPFTVIASYDAEDDLLVKISTSSDPGPEVTNIYTDQADGYYNDEDTIDYTYVVFSEDVDVTGTPQLTLETGGTDEVLDYVSGTGTQILKFAQWSVEADDSHTSSDLDAKSLALNGGTILASDDAAVADLTLPTGATLGSLAGNHAIVIDTTADTQTSWTGVTTDASSFTSSSDTIEILLTLPDSAGYDATAAPNWPKIQALIAYPAITTYAYYLNQVTATTFLFGIYLGADYRTTGLTLTGNLLTAGGSFLDQAGNAISATYPSSPNRLQDDKTYVVAVPGTFTICPSGCTGTSYAGVVTALNHLVSGDRINLRSDIVEDITMSVDGTVTTWMILDLENHVIRGDLIVASDYTRVIGANGITGTITVTGTPTEIKTNRFKRWWRKLIGRDKWSGDM